MPTHPSPNADSTAADSKQYLQTGVILPARLKVLHIISGDLWAGAEVQAFTLIDKLNAQCEICVALMNHGELEQRLSAAGVKVQVFDEAKKSARAIIQGLNQLIKTFSPDLIHSHRQKENILGCLANILAHWPLKQRAISVRTQHGAAEYKSAGIKKLIAKADTWCGKYLQDAVIAVSADLATKLDHDFKPEHIHLICNGVNIDPTRLTPATDVRALAPQALHVGIIGRLEAVKRVDIFLQLAAHFRAEKAQIYFHVIGDGKERDSLHYLAKQLELDNLHFHGHRSDSQAAMAALDFIVMCSDHEGTPMTSLEALALGKPLIAHKVGGLAEVLAEHQELLVADHSPAGYINCLREQLQAPSKVGLPAKYTSLANVNATMSLYQQLQDERNV